MSGLLTGEEFTGTAAALTGNTTDGATPDGPGSLDPLTWAGAGGLTSLARDGAGLAYCQGNAGNAGSVVDVGQSDVEIVLTNAQVAPLSGVEFAILFRWQDANNYLKLDIIYTTALRLYLYSVIGGVSTAIANLSAAAAGDTLKVVTAGTTVTSYRNGTQVDSRTIANFSTATKHGLWISNPGNQVTRAERFQVYGVVAAKGDLWSRWW